MTVNDYYDQDVVVRITGEASIWLRKRQIEEMVRDGKSMREVSLTGMVQQIVEEAMEKEE